MLSLVLVLATNLHPKGVEVGHLEHLVATDLHPKGVEVGQEKELHGHALISHALMLT